MEFGGYRLWCINTGKSLIPLTLRFLAQKRNLLIPLELSRVMHQGIETAELHASAVIFLAFRHEMTITHIEGG